MKTNTRIDTDASAEGSFIDVFDASASYKYVSDKSSDWTLASSSFNSQLTELNSYNENNFEWQKVGEFVKPKTIKVVKLVKALMSRNLVFSRVKREYYDAPFKRLVSLNTFNNVYLPSNVQENVQRIISLENALRNLDQTISQKLNQSNSLLNDQLNNSANVTLNLLRASHSNLAANITSLSNNLRETNNTFMSLLRMQESSLQTLSSKIKISRIEKGTWEVNNFQVNQATYNCVVSAYKTFSAPFQESPTIFYTLRKNHVADNWSALYSIYNEQITRNGLSFSVQFVGRSYVYAFAIDWVAIGK